MKSTLHAMQFFSFIAHARLEVRYTKSLDHIRDGDIRYVANSATILVSYALLSMCLTFIYPSIIVFFIKCSVTHGSTH